MNKNPPTVSEVSWRVIGWRESVFQDAPGEPWRAGSSCDRCGQSIRYVVTVKSSAGETLNVGQDCAVTLEGGPTLADVRRAEQAYERSRYLASDEYRSILERQASEKAAAASRALVAESTCGMILAGLRAIEASGNNSGDERDTARARIKAILSGAAWAQEFDIDDADTFYLPYVKACLPDSTHLATVGARVTVRVLVEAMIPFETRFGSSYVQKFRTVDGHVLVWFSPGGSLRHDHIGQWVTLTGTVKAHSTRDDVPQTVMTRCKVRGDE